MPVLEKEPTIFRYPERIKEDFLKTPDIRYEDGEVVTAQQVWDFMTEEGPKRFPHAFSYRRNYGWRQSPDVDFFSGIRRSYIGMTSRDRIIAAHEKGVPLVMVQGGQPFDVYYAAGSIPLRPARVNNWAKELQEGLNLREFDQRGLDIMEGGRNKVSMDACNLVATHAAVGSGVVPIDLVAPILALRCSDMVYLVESLRGRLNHPSLQVLDYPINQSGKSWAVDLVTEELRKLIVTISKLSKKKVTDADLHDQIVNANKGRKIARSIIRQWWAAELPPISTRNLALSVDNVGGSFAAIQMLEEMKDEVETRIKNKVLGTGVNPNAKRVFLCGSCVGVQRPRIEHAGCNVVGHEESWSLLNNDVKETGDPLRALAEGILGLSYELPTAQRAHWTAQAIKESRADGVILLYNWGCNYQSSIARMEVDLIKAETGLPTTLIEIDEKFGHSGGTEQSENRIQAFLEML